jgi:hypothetical protein
MQKAIGKRQRRRRRRISWENNITERGCKMPGTAELASTVLSGGLW